jgi:hypothetical protein
MPDETEKYLLLVKVTGLGESEINAKALALHADYMARYGANPLVRTAVHLRLTGRREDGSNNGAVWSRAIYYEGPPESVAWLQQQILAAASDPPGVTVETATYTVDDVTEGNGASSP